MVRTGLGSFRNPKEVPDLAREEFLPQRPSYLIPKVMKMTSQVKRG